MMYVIFVHLYSPQGVDPIEATGVLALIKIFGANNIVFAIQYFIYFFHTVCAKNHYKCNDLLSFWETCPFPTL